MKWIFKIVIIVFYFANGYSQSTINCMAGGTTLNGIIHEASIGEMACIHTHSAGGFHLTQGVLQKIDVNLVSALSRGIQFAIDVYPNPTLDMLNLRFHNAQPTAINFEIIDVTGKKLLKRDDKISNSTEVFSFDLSTFSKGIYLLNVHANGGTDKYSKISYQIEKR